MFTFHPLLAAAIDEGVGNQLNAINKLPVYNRHDRRILTWCRKPLDSVPSLNQNPVGRRSGSEKMVEMLFAQLNRVLRSNFLRLRGPSGGRDEFLPVASNLKPSEYGPQRDHRHQRQHRTTDADDG
jgi:hypothetical protein